MYACMYSSDHITYQLSPQNLHTAVVTVARLTSEWPGSVLPLLKIFTVPVTVDVFETEKVWWQMCSESPLTSLSCKPRTYN